MEQTMQKMDADFKRFITEVDGKLSSLLEDVANLADGVKDVTELQNEISVLKKALSNESLTVPKVKVPEPKAFHGVRNAKELENFLWDMEQYFIAAHIPIHEQVSITSMYLAGDAKLWWRTRTQDDMNVGRPRIEEWNNLKKELKVQFLPCNAAWIARESLKKLRHTSSVHEYVKEFSSLMLDISNMSEEDNLFNFMSGLQPWAQTELRRQGVKDLPSAMAAADSLVDLNLDHHPATNNGKDATSKGSKKFEAKEKGKANSSKNQSQDRNKWSSGCFICAGPHLARHCPKNEQLNALVAEESSSDAAEKALLSPMQLLNALTIVESKKESMYMPIKVDGEEVLGTLDSGATINFVDVEVARELGLEMSQNSSMVKAVDSEAKSVEGTTTVCMKIAVWEGEYSLLAAALDDYDLILNMEFFRMAKVGTVSYLGGIFFVNEKFPCFVEAKDADQLLYRMENQLVRDARQSKARVKKGETRPDATLMEIKPEKILIVPENVVLPLSYVKDYKMKLEASARRPHAQAFHGAVPLEKAKQRRHYGVLQEAGPRRLSKVRYGAELLQMKQQGLSDHDN
ncbi:uncharacterized protein LOC126783937 [Argentina anserina]|uniref:uncharacterized protein LOC126783937 n=1 Tax=Argentina anserina TaxID=57926 RepID=UPI0021764FF5|nr:uncharacterized protein LOC126783937 [Potentilla anserina]